MLIRCVAASVSPSDVSEIKLVFSIPPHRPTPNFPPTWNAAPTDVLPVVRYDAKAGEHSLDLLRWGLVPYWAKDIKVGFANINAKAEGIETRPAFREAFQRRRCLVPVDNFYEWKETPIGKQPYAIALADRRLMALAGLWENWRSLGDVISGGTAAGTAADSSELLRDNSSAPERFLKPGDVVEMCSPSIGSLRTRVVAKSK
jgi:putative SOS response-associated peptidase YedK